jgi:hypothetical protein
LEEDGANIVSSTLADELLGAPFASMAPRSSGAHVGRYSVFNFSTVQIVQYLLTCVFSPLPHLMVADDQRVLSLRLRLQVCSLHFLHAASVPANGKCARLSLLHIPYAFAVRTLLQLFPASGPRIHCVFPHRSEIAFSHDPRPQVKLPQRQRLRPSNTCNAHSLVRSLVDLGVEPGPAI